MAAIQALANEHPGRKVSVLGVSVGAGPALLAAADPRVANRVGTVLSLGGYASAVELLRYFLTGAYAYGEISGRVAPQPDAARLFLRANLDLLKNAEDRRALDAWLATGGSRPPARLTPDGEAVMRLVENRDPGKVDGLVQALPPDLQRLLARLSPEHVAGRIRGRLLLIHGRRDPAVPFTESLRLAAAARGNPGTRLVLVGVLMHVEPGDMQAHRGEMLRELWQFWSLLLDVFTSA